MLTNIITIIIAKIILKLRFVVKIKLNNIILNTQGNSPVHIFNAGPELGLGLFTARSSCLIQGQIQGGEAGVSPLLFIDQHCIFSTGIPRNPKGSVSRRHAFREKFEKI